MARLPWLEWYRKDGDQGKDGEGEKAGTERTRGVCEPADERSCGKDHEDAKHIDEAHGDAGAQTLSQVFAFDCPPPYDYGCPDGAKLGSIMQATDGNLYGLTESSNGEHGTNIGGWYAGGTLFKINPSNGQLTLLYTFSENTTTGFYPNGSQPKSLVQGPDGYLYGVADGGSNAASAGLIFKVSTTGSNFQVVETFCTSCTNGGFPTGIVAGTDGNLYGTTGNGGYFKGEACQGLGCGVVFRLTTSGKYTALHALNGATDGVGALGVIQASDGNLYGTTSGYTPTIFRVNPSTGQYTVLHTYTPGTGPRSSLIEASNGLLYGLSSTTAGYLTMYSTTLGGNVQVLSEVQCGGSKASGLFTARLLQASDGNLWGVCGAYGANNIYGEVFTVSTSGVPVTTVGFNDSDGAYPDVGVIQAKNGILYGTTFDGGTDAKGVPAFGNVYAISGLPPAK
jgi:uncharacterized repeat protein (TIGR03803 family)